MYTDGIAMQFSLVQLDRNKPYICGDVLGAVARCRIVQVPLSLT